MSIWNTTITNGNSTGDDVYVNVNVNVDVDVMDQLGTKVAFGTVYCFIFVLGLCGNAMVIGAVLRSRRMYTVTNILILNLAVSDINVTVVSVVFTPLATFMKTWLFGQAWCKLVGMLSCVSIYASSLTSTVIAVDRYLVVVHPLRGRITFRALVSAIAAIWCVSAVVAIPLAVFNGVVVSEQGVALCVELWPAPEAKHLFSICSFFLQFIVPLTIIAYCYSRTWITLENRLKNRCRWRTRTPNAEREEREIRRRRRMTRMLTAMVSLYATCWMVFNLYTIIDDLVRLSAYFDYDAITFQVVHTVAVSSVVYNPLLYGWMNDNFRKQFARMCMCLLGESRRAPLIIETQQNAALLHEHEQEHDNTSGHIYPVIDKDNLCESSWIPMPSASSNNPSPPIGTFVSNSNSSNAPRSRNNDSHNNNHCNTVVKLRNGDSHDDHSVELLVIR